MHRHIGEEPPVVACAAQDVVAYHISEPRAESNGVLLPGSEALIRYFDQRSLHDFLFNEEKIDDGCLQKLSVADFVAELAVLTAGFQLQQRRIVSASIRHHSFIS